VTDVEGREKPAAGEALGGKTVWDWLQLLGVLAIPVVIAVGGWMFGAQQSAHQNKLEDQRAKNERQIEVQRAQDAALQAYLDQMSQLMLGGDLRSSEEDSEVRTLARARTRTVLARLNSQRKGSVVQFLYEADLINKKHPVVSLSKVPLVDADLSGAELSGADLREADLRKANLSGANLSDADLSLADLRKANLSTATLGDADLDGAYLQLANLSRTNLLGADLRGGANLTGANLSEAELIGALLSDTYLIDANLREADLSGAFVTEEQLQQAKTLEGATMPNGSIND
jgi:uncharacterized protein YjbI with pentapeptide repeats